MARHISVLVILAIAAIVILSFRSSFGGVNDREPRVAPAHSNQDGSAAESKGAAGDAKTRIPELKAPFTSKDDVVVAETKESVGENKADLTTIPSDILTGDVIAPKLENATAKAELGRASWKLFHTMMARFPEEPSEDDSLALKTYVQLFARLYPCGDCARHFQQLLAKYPPQTSSRNTAASWACYVHNEVNKRLEKEEFDCAKIGDFYDCGCGDEDKKKDGDTATATEDEAAELKEKE